MISFLLFYWFFSTLFCLGISYEISKYKLTRKDFIVAIIFGWIMFPFTLGVTRVQITENKY
jgi:ABC-type glycerol-3-phosphate transport system permease component